MGEHDYNAGRSTRVPMTPRVRLPRQNRFSRKLRYNTMGSRLSGELPEDLRPQPKLSLYGRPIRQTC